MNIKCKKCLAENPIGTIFCRLCGEKLSFEDIDSEIRSGIHKRERSNFFRSLRRGIALIFVISAFAAAYLVIDPFNSSLPKTGEISKTEESDALSVITTIDFNRKGTFTISSVQLAFLANKYLSENDKIVTASIIKGSLIKFTYSEQLFEYKNIKLSLKKSAILRPRNIVDEDGKESVEFQLESIRFGLLPIPSAANSFFEDDFRSFADNAKLKRVLKRVQALEISENNTIELTIK